LPAALQQALLQDSKAREAIGETTGEANVPKLRIKSQKRWGFVILPRARFWRVNFSNSFLLYKKI
jgi:hypothetical protein